MWVNNRALVELTSSIGLLNLANFGSRFQKLLKATCPEIVFTSHAIRYKCFCIHLLLYQRPAFALSVRLAVCAEPRRAQTCRIWNDTTSPSSSFTTYPLVALRICLSRFLSWMESALAQVYLLLPVTVSALLHNRQHLYHANLTNQTSHMRRAAMIHIVTIYELSAQLLWR